MDPQNKELEKINFVMCGVKYFEILKDKCEQKIVKKIIIEISFLVPSGLGDCA